jgi:hypothetical protein
MKPGDLIVIRAFSHSYPKGWERGQDCHKYEVDTLVVFLSEKRELGEYNPRTFYTVLTSFGIHDVFSGYCLEIST